VDEFEAEEEGSDNEGTAVGGGLLEVDASLMRSPPFRTLKDDGIEEGEPKLMLVGEKEVGIQREATMRS